MGTLRRYWVTGAWATGATVFPRTHVIKVLR